MGPNRSIAAIALLVLTAACQQQAPPATEPFTVRDSAGIEIVESAGPLWAEGSGWMVADSPSVEIGVEDGDPRYLLDGVVGATRMSDGRIVLVNSGTAEVRLYDAEGGFLHAVGRKGGGPGEFRRPEHLLRVEGDTLLVWDVTPGPVSVFDPSGRYVRREPIDPGVIMAAIGRHNAFERLTPLPDRSFVLHVKPRGNPHETGTPPGEIYRPAIGFFRFSRDLVLRDTLGWYGGLPQMYLMLDGRPVYQTVMITTHAQVDVGGSPLRIYAGNGDPYEVHEFDDENRLVRIVRRTDPPVAIPDSTASRISESRRVGTSPYVAQRRRVMDAMPQQTHYPAYHDLFVDREGLLWVFGYNGDTSVFDSEGRWLGRVPLPGRPLEIGSDYVLVLARDALGVERIRLYDLRRSG